MKRGFAKHWMLLGLMGGVLSAVGCGGPGYVAIYARTAPPPIRVESQGRPPGSGYVWINGYWGYRGNDYVWNAGRWGTASPRAPTLARRPLGASRRPLRVA
jgi:hypothetical protein